MGTGRGHMWNVEVGHKRPGAWIGHRLARLTHRVGIPPGRLRHRLRTANKLEQLHTLRHAVFGDDEVAGGQAFDHLAVLEWVRIHEHKVRI